jgi:hypothetical protein
MAEMRFNIEDFFSANVPTYADVEAAREDVPGYPLIQNLAQIVADVPIGHFDDRADETFPWQDSHEVTIAMDQP